MMRWLLHNLKIERKKEEEGRKVNDMIDKIKLNLSSSSLLSLAVLILEMIERWMREKRISHKSDFFFSGFLLLLYSSLCRH